MNDENGLGRSYESLVTAQVHLPMRRSVFNPVGLMENFPSC